MKRTLAAAAVAALVLAAGAAHAAVLRFTDETDYRAAIDAMGYARLVESFEDDAVWGAARSPAVAAAVASKGITWSSNHSVNGVSTSNGPVKAGEWGFYSLPHGVFSNDMKASCMTRGICGDGFVGTSARTLYGIGGWIKTAGGNTAFSVFLDGSTAPSVLEDEAVNVAFSFFGLIDTDGFSAFRYQEMEFGYFEKDDVPGVFEWNDLQYLFADKFTFAAAS
ncbi:MAG: hypothetical protein ACU85V_20975, partial [Gammaproteobacteria bacterium]